MNAYLSEFLARQRFAELLAEADRDRLIRSVKGSRQRGRARLNGRVRWIVAMARLAIDAATQRDHSFVKPMRSDAAERGCRDGLKPCL
jgi:hypothetical protein